MEESKNLTKDKNKLLVIAGILHSAKAFTGPEVLHIDLTNRCNFNCIACWCRSPLLSDKAMPEWERKLSLPLHLIKGVFDDLGCMGGLRQLKIVGGGEPFMHPSILEIVEYAKEKDKNIQIDINTNFSLVDEKVAVKLIELGVDSLTVSLWAGTPEVYASVHPNQTVDTFNNISNTLKLISKMKQIKNTLKPRITFHNVIFNLNYRDINEMISFALRVRADDIQFVPVDTIKDRTEPLLLNGSERSALLESLYEIKKNYNSATFEYKTSESNLITLSDFDGFIRRIEKLNTLTGAYDKEIVEEYPCYAGWLFARIMATGDVVPCCKGHRMRMGNIYGNRFKDIWFSDVYNKFRRNGLSLDKRDPYFSKIGNNADSKTGCYNCDNLWQNIPMHKRISQFRSNPLISKLSSSAFDALCKRGTKAHK
jgi:MoaA/NifB/PqqE/SkfB family radical SAM enzyme